MLAVFKVYNVKRADEHGCTIGFNLGYKWEFISDDFQCVSEHTTIKAAERAL